MTNQTISSTDRFGLIIFHFRCTRNSTGVSATNLLLLPKWSVLARSTEALMVRQRGKWLTWRLGKIINRSTDSKVANYQIKINY